MMTATQCVGDMGPSRGLTQDSKVYHPAPIKCRSSAIPLSYALPSAFDPLSAVVHSVPASLSPDLPSALGPPSVVVPPIPDSLSFALPSICIR